MEIRKVIMQLKTQRPSRMKLARRRQFTANVENLETRQLLSTLLVTDKWDYAPGSIAEFTGSGFAHNEPIDLNIVSQINGAPNPAGSATLPDVVTSDNNGSFTYDWNVGDNNIGASLTATATGETALDWASTTFTDSGSLFTFTDSAGNTEQTSYQYPDRTDVYIKALTKGQQLAAGDYYVEVTDAGQTPVQLGVSATADLHVDSNGNFSNTANGVVQVWSLVNGFHITDTTNVYKVLFSKDPNFAGNNSTTNNQEFKCNESPAQLTLNTQVFTSPVKVAVDPNVPLAPGSNVYDTANLTGIPTGDLTPAGQVTYTFYTNGTASGTGTPEGTVTLDANGLIPWSAIVSSLAPGTYSFKAHYTGDFDYKPADSPVEPFTVGKLDTTLTTNASTTNQSTVVGSALLTDSATLSGGLNPTGTITFTLTAPDGSKTTESVAVTGDGTYTTPTSVLATQVGTYTWSASYNGDTLNNGASDNGDNETATTIKASPALATQVAESNGNVVGTATLSDTATLSGGYSVSGGTITFTLTAPDGSKTTESVAVTGDGTYTTPTSVLATQVGTYTWSAVYSGDDLNQLANDQGDAAEQATTVKATPTISTQAAGSGVVGTTLTLSDTANLSGGYNVQGGTITFTLKAPDGSTVYSKTVNVAGDGTYAVSTSFKATLAGTYTWSASYSGNNLNNVASDNGVNETTKIGQNGLTLGYYSNKNGQQDLTGTTTGKSLLTKIYNPLFGTGGVLVNPNTNPNHVTKPDSGGYSVLVDANGQYVPLSFFSTYANVQSYLLNATATNMAYMLSAQLLTTEFNILLGRVDPTEQISVAQVTIPSTGQFMSSSLEQSLKNHGVTASVGGVVTIQTLLTDAIAELMVAPYTVVSGDARSYEEALKDCFDAINNNELAIFV
jgi:hypothetical protein